MITRSVIERIAAEFWAAAGGRERYGHPVDMGAAVSVALRIPVIKVDDLTFEKANAFLKRLGGPQHCGDGSQRLHGLIVADQDAAFIFVDSSDDPAEQRATIGHEVSHFVRHYTEPRQRARRILGPSIDDVLMRRRPPAPSERFAAVMQGVPLACFRCGEPHQRASLLGSAQEIEDEADAIALEILAPRRDIQRRRLRDPSSIAQEYGIPPRMAQIAEGLLGPVERSPVLLDIFRTRARGAPKSRRGTDRP